MGRLGAQYLPPLRAITAWREASRGFRYSRAIAAPAFDVEVANYVEQALLMYGSKPPLQVLSFSHAVGPQKWIDAIQDVVGRMTPNISTWQNDRFWILSAADLTKFPQVADALSLGTLPMLLVTARIRFSPDTLVGILAPRPHGWVFTSASDWEFFARLCARTQVLKHEDWRQHKTIYSIN